MSKPKAVLFDIGGVCVISPMQAILDFEIANGIPKDYINFAISQAAPDGAWHQLERGELKMDDAFFSRFHSDLHRQDLWEKYHKSFKNRRLADLAKSNATRLGDPISLKAEASDRVPTPGEAGAGPSLGLATTARSTGGSGLKESYQKNLLGDPTSLKNEGGSSEPVVKDDQATGYAKDGSYSSAGSGSSQRSSSGDSSLQQSYKKNMLGDPTSLKNEGSSHDPIPGQDDGAHSRSSISNGVPTSRSSTNSNSMKEKYKKNMLGDPTSLKNEGSDSSPLPDQADTGYSKPSSSFSSSNTIPPLPKMDTTALFWEMMRISRTPDPNMFPALHKLRESKKFVVGALSNTVIFPPDHEYSKPNNIHTSFEVFISSAHVGLRKPDPAIYRLAVEELDKADRKKGGSGLTAKDVVFLDDIGSNLRAAREVGLRTIKVNLGRVREAVAELGSITGLQLADNKSKL